MPDTMNGFVTYHAEWIRCSGVAEGSSVAHSRRTGEWDQHGHDPHDLAFVEPYQLYSCPFILYILYIYTYTLNMIFMM